MDKEQALKIVKEFGIDNEAPKEIMNDLKSLLDFVDESIMPIEPGTGCDDLLPTYNETMDAVAVLRLELQ
jgi:hypothetical protein